MLPGRSSEMANEFRNLLPDYRTFVPPAARAFSSVVFGSREPMTEQFFTPEEIDILRQTVEQAEADNRRYFGYPDYAARDPNLNININAPKNVLNALFDRRASLANTLGHAAFERLPDGTIVIRDRYDFHASPEDVAAYSGASGFGRLLIGSLPYGPMGTLNAVGNYVAPRGEGRPVEIRIPPAQNR
jgi:hypothetical protein